MRTQEEILERIKQVSSEDIFGTQTSDLIQFLTYDNAKQFLSKEAAKLIEDGEKEWIPDTDPIAEIKSYMDFAWEKANNRRGLSAIRSLQHMKTWLWLAGEDAMSKSLDEYTHYGKPQLVKICEKYDIDWKALDDDRWVNNEDDIGKPATKALEDLINES